MKYSEAIKKKSKIGETIQHDNLRMKVLVSPYNDADFTRFVDDYRVVKFDNQSCLKYSTDNLFKVVGLWTDGTNVIHKKL